MNDKRSTLNTNEGLISKQAVLDLFDEHVGVMSNFSKVWDAVEHLPSATIRCKDCAFLKKGHNQQGDDMRGGQMTREQKLDLAAFNEVVEGLCSGIPCTNCPFDDGDVCRMQQWVKQMSIEALQAQADGDLVSRQAVLDAINFEDIWLADAKSHNSNTKIAFSGMYKAINNLPTWETTEAIIKRSGFLKFIAENMNADEYQWYYNQYYHTTDEKVGGQDG